MSEAPDPHWTTVPVPPLRRRPRRGLAQKPLGTFDVFVDDAIGLAQGGTLRRQRLRRILFTAIDTVFRPLDAGDSPHRQEPISVKKLLKGDGCWTTRKVILGWLIDTVQQTIALPPHRVARFLDILTSVPLHQKRITLTKWQQLLGELRSMLLGIPGARGLFSHLQEAFRHHDGKRIRLSSAVHAALTDFRWLARDLARRPTRLAEILPTPDAALGACDAARAGMGGVAFVPLNVAPRAPYARALTHLSTADTSNGADPIAASSLVLDRSSLTGPIPHALPLGPAPHSVPSTPSPVPTTALHALPATCMLDTSLVLGRSSRTSPFTPALRLSTAPHSVPSTPSPAPLAALPTLH